MIAPSLVPGTLLGPYEVESFIGAGGMGEVYRAHDTRISRTVAIKILIGGVPADQRRRERFHAEARTIASLNHPHVPAFHDVGSSEGVDFLVMEFIEGVTLASVIKGGSLTLERSFRHAIETSEALAEAHRRGIVHCDIKPANIMVTTGGIKLLDFGIARLWDDLHAPIDPDAATTATEDSSAAGTTAYMAPERFAGAACDTRGDVYALGVILYELFTGRKPFNASSKVELLATIRKTEPPPPSSINGELPSELDHVILKCLAREPEARWQATADLASELSWIRQLSRKTPPRRTVPALLSFVVGPALLMLAAALAVAMFRQDATATEPAEAAVRFLLEAEPGSSMTVSPGAFVVSPDGTTVAFTASSVDGKRTLWLRSIGGDDKARALPGTDDAWNPFWRSDSRRLGFFTGDRIRSVDVGSGTVTTVGVVPTGSPRGATATWSAEGEIVIAAGPLLLGMNDVDGTVRTLDLHPGARGLRFAGPSVLPDGRRFLYHVKGDASSPDGLYVGSLDMSAPPRRLADSDSQAAYVEPGYLLYAKRGVLIALPVDPGTLAPTGPIVTLVGSVSLFNTFNQAAFSASRRGVLAYRVGVINSELRWVDRSGRLLSALAPPAPYANPALSPDGTRVAITRFDQVIGTADLWVIDSRGGLVQLTSSPEAEDFATWAPDGNQVLFAANRAGVNDLFTKHWNADASAPFEPVLFDGRNKMPYQWGTVRRMLLFLASGPDGYLNGRFFAKPRRGKVHAVPTTGELEAREDGQPQVSPDGRWIAYVSDVTGSPHVFVRRFPEAESRWLVSPAGGFEPRWRGDGRELFYLAPDGTLMAVAVTDEGGVFSADVPRPLFRTGLVGAYLGSPFPNSRVRNEYQVTADGQRFLINEPIEGRSAYGVHMLVNWSAEVARRARVPARQHSFTR